MKGSQLALLLLLCACETATAPLDPGPDTGEDPALSAPPQTMIVVLTDRVDPRQVAREHGVAPDHVFSQSMNGFVGRMGDIARGGLLRDQRVVRVRPNRTLQLEETQINATWGLDRIDQRAAPLDGTFTYPTRGEGVTVYVIDTGIDFAHAEFGGRAAAGFDAYGGSGADCHGHGTHVAGTAGGSIYGVAKSARLVAVRVLDCDGSGTTASVLAGIEWILGNGARPGVVNMSFGGEGDALLDDAVRRLHQAGFVVAIAAGNSSADACGFSPARAPEGITVGASARSDDRAMYSNFGNCLDWFAPGNSITSAAAGTTNGTLTLSGTSMAAPHVAGALALYLEQDPTATPQQAIDALGATLTRNAVGNARSVNNHLLFSLALPSGTPGNSEPVARFSASCTRLSCTFDDQSSDVDGSIVERNWDFGDSDMMRAGPEQAEHTYAVGGVYRASLVVKDDGGALSTWAVDVPVGLVLSTITYKQRNKLSVSLAWKGAQTDQVQVLVNGVIQDTVENNGSYRLALRARGSYTIKVCETGPAPMCSAESTVAS